MAAASNEGWQRAKGGSLRLAAATRARKDPVIGQIPWSLTGQD